MNKLIANITEIDNVIKGSHIKTAWPIKETECKCNDVTAKYISIYRERLAEISMEPSYESELFLRSREQLNDNPGIAE